MKRYLADWSWRDSIEEVEISKESDSSVWIIEKGKAKLYRRETETSMYCPTYPFAREKIRQEKQKVIDSYASNIRHYEKQLQSFLDKYPEIQ